MWALRKDCKKLSAGQRVWLAQIAVTNKQRAAAVQGECDADRGSEDDGADVGDAGFQCGDGRVCLTWFTIMYWNVLGVPAHDGGPAASGHRPAGVPAVKAQFPASPQSALVSSEWADQRIQPSRLTPRRNRRPAPRSYFERDKFLAPKHGRHRVVWSYGEA